MGGGGGVKAWSWIEIHLSNSPVSCSCGTPLPKTKIWKYLSQSSFWHLARILKKDERHIPGAPPCTLPLPIPLDQLLKRQKHHVCGRICMTFEYLPT